MLLFYCKSISYRTCESSVNKYKIIILGAESKSYLNKALLIDPNNIQALIDRGSLYYYAPSVLGGDKKEALKFQQKAASIFERNNQTKKNWVYINLLTMIATTYKSLDQLENAKLMYEKIIRIDPNIDWVKNKEYPRLLRRIQNEK